MPKKPESKPFKKKETNIFWTGWAQNDPSLRPYDPVLDGWNTHTLHREPTVDELILRKDNEFDGLDDEF